MSVNYDVLLRSPAGAVYHLVITKADGPENVKDSDKVIREHILIRANNNWD